MITKSQKGGRAMNSILQVVSEAVALIAPLAPYFAKAGEAVAKKIGEDGYEKVKAIYGAIHAKLRSDSDSEALQVLHSLEGAPADEEHRAALAHALTAKVIGDPEFATNLERLVEAAKQNRNLARFMTNISGDAEVGKVINIGQADNTTIY